jgi:hypothetical protein
VRYRVWYRTIVPCGLHSCRRSKQVAELRVLLAEEQVLRITAESQRDTVQHTLKSELMALRPDLWPAAKKEFAAKMAMNVKLKARLLAADRRAAEAEANGSGPPGWLSGLSVSHSKSVLYGAFQWARMALNRQKRRFPARAVAAAASSREAAERLAEGAPRLGPPL